MKNADLPAMPVDGEFWVDPTNTKLGTENYHGLTKREMMAMHICSGNMAARTAPWSNVSVKLMTEIAVQMADELLAELERTK